MSAPVVPDLIALVDGPRWSAWDGWQGVEQTVSATSPLVTGAARHRPQTAR